MTLTTTDLNSLTAEDIANQLIGVGIKVENVTITGSNQGIGTFSEGLSEGIGINEGVILSSGNIADAVGPNDSNSTGISLGTSGDTDLNALLEANQETNNQPEQTTNSTNQQETKTTNDATVLEFDFTPENEQFLLQYVFASDEYNEFANSDFNDIFAFFLNGKNIALIPGTSIPVSINNINATDNSAFFRNNELGGSVPYNTEFDGFTTIFAAQASVTPGEKQHLKLVIADTSDSILDSAVFLKAKSLSTLPPSLDATVSYNENNIFNVNGSPGFTKLKFTLSGTNADYINEVGVFVVDDEEGRIAGVAPGETDYEKLALTGARSRAIFTGLSHNILENGSQTRLLNYDVGDKLGFYLITKGTTDTVLSDTPLYIHNPQPQVLFSFPKENFDNSEHLKVSDREGGGLTLAWDDMMSDGDFDDLVLNVKTVSPVEPSNSIQGTKRQGEIQKEIIDLSNLGEQELITANFNIKSEADFNDTVGLYRIEDVQGTVTDPLTGNKLTPEDEGYQKAAIQNKVVEFGQNGGGSSDLGSGLYAPFIIVNGNSEGWLFKNPNNQIYLQTFAYFPFLNANKNGGTFAFDRITLLGDNTFGFEDFLSSKSDWDYNDMVMQVSFAE